MRGHSIVWKLHSRKSTYSVLQQNIATECCAPMFHSIALSLAFFTTTCDLVSSNIQEKTKDFPYLRCSQHRNFLHIHSSGIFGSLAAKLRQQWSSTELYIFYIVCMLLRYTAVF